MLFCLQVASTQVNGFDWLAKVSNPVRDAVDQWVAAHILRLATPLELLWRFMDESLGDLYTAAIDEHQQRMRFTPEPHPPQVTGVIEMHYTRIDDNHFELAGRVGTQDVTMRLERGTGTRSPLMTRGFHWISETSFDQ